MSVKIVEIVPKSTDSCTSSVCRLCLSEESHEDIFEQEDLVILIADFLSIVISEDDTFSRSICTRCRARLIEFRDFKWRCLEVQELLQGELFAVVDEEVPLLEQEYEDVQIPTEEEDFDTVEVVDVVDTAEPFDNETKDVEPEHKFESMENRPKRKKKQHQLKRIEYTKSGKKRYVYDLTEVYRNQLEECSTCGKMISKVRMEGHQNMHQGIRPFKCERGCDDRDFHCQQLRLHHYRNVHDGERHECDVCLKVYRSRRSLNYHKKDVHSVKPFQCPKCSQAFSSNARLRQHLKYHNREKNHPCSQCTYSFYSKNDLKKHLKRHEQ
ncbi:zinc finger protein interacting with ribonucleoprotein K-like [Aedes aegypti]|uniref:Uncharacterized protein n=1 Tax=Aedes aegypti TaxID=7159 RepID=A0A6I8U044_AEDAE|nr:zinc finger protein interacting with ribonucleoprotein K-like [Aedes aegypti]